MDYPWYDSTWLYVYNEARSIVATTQANRLADFEAAFKPLHAPTDFSTQKLAGLIPQQQLDDFRHLIKSIAQESIESHEFLSFGREVIHDHPDLLQFQEDQTALVSELAGETLVSSYNFISLYHNLGVCEPHMDAPLSKWTLDICIDQSDPWPIFISEPAPWPLGKSFGENWKAELLQQHQNSFTEHVMQPGDALFFSGSNQWHYRNRIAKTASANFCHLIFLHYVPAHCEHLLDPTCWPDYFGIPALTALAPLFNEYKNKEEDSHGISILSLINSLKQTIE